VDFRRACAVLLLALSVSGRLASAQDRKQKGSLLFQFRESHDLAEKSRILDRIVQSGSQSGAPLLRLARTTEDNDTRWLAIRGLGELKFQAAAPFLLESLHADQRYVRANAARALGELRYSLAGPALIHLLETEQDGGVIEQTSAALRMIDAKGAVPALKSRISFDSAQTRCWLLEAIGSLGSKDDTPFVASYLYDTETDVGRIPFCAAQALAILTGQNFGLPKTSGLFDPYLPVSNARAWWEKARQESGLQ
jgi:HEAT repeat protein